MAHFSILRLYSVIYIFGIVVSKLNRLGTVKTAAIQFRLDLAIFEIIVFFAPFKQ